MDNDEKKTITTFALASFLNDLGSDLIYPIWPLFVTGILGANMAVLGLLDGLGEALVALSQAGAGYLSDKIRQRKVFIYWGYLFGAISRFGYAFAVIWQHLIPFRSALRYCRQKNSHLPGFSFVGVHLFKHHFISP